MEPRGPSASERRAGRREVLKGGVAAATWAALGGPAAGQPESRAADEPGSRPAVPAEVAAIIARYLEGLAKADGGYGWADQQDSHLYVTFAAIGAYHTMDLKPPRAEQAAAFIRRGHPITGPAAETKKHWAELRELVYQQIQAILWLGQDAADFREQVLGWKQVATYTATYEKGENPILRQEVQPIICRQLLGLPLTGLAGFSDYLAKRRRPNGSFNNTPAGDGSDGHVVNTYFGLRAQKALGVAPAAEAAGWIDRCQLPGGAFTWCPQPAIGAVADVGYTWAAIQALALLGRRPARQDECIAWLRSLWNADGGFADRPGGPSEPMACYLALDALRALGATPGETRQPPRRPAALPADLEAFTIQIQAPGSGSPIEAVELARLLRIHLWGAKNSTPQWMARAQDVARRRGVRVTFFPASEDYGSRVEVPGLGNYSHVNDPVARPGEPLEPWPRREGAWPQFRAERLEPLWKAGGRMLWQICDNEEFARILLDESLVRGGYAMISTFHFGCLNMAWTLPFVMRYRHEIALVALQDAHSESWWWAENLSGFRTVFLAKSPTWDGWLEALDERRVAAIRRDAGTYGKLRILGGSAEVRRRVLERQAQWQWWDEAGTVLDRMPASVVALKPEDAFEAGRPAAGVNLRIRTRRAWAPGKLLAAQPLVECQAVSVDGRKMRPGRREKHNAKKKLEETYLLVELGQLAAGEHTYELRLVEPATGRTWSYTGRFGI